ncbi:uncharacterized protein BDW43DRAFT_305077 [Aspergillus alliaceus]|uniref:uncharacterized protein n=1 Tax=Petromyces alliaceus TaxID=209559 RepID=UPI0012A41CCF|nr:uncharacterized protein BDW43DRAFT_305077 [Aspergillus alliaceus]KAB8226790.1 hypothetical protein BDW43DRAFT_305077 [Aspergillus alliaceus]
MDDDSIRNRAALVQLHTEYQNIIQAGHEQSLTRRGRGYASLIIDNLLEEIHHDWASSDEQQRSKLRALFHNRKRFGKRWTLLTQHLGSGILFLCSHKLESMVKDTAVTVQCLGQVSNSIANSSQDIIKLLHLLDPLANSLVQNNNYCRHNINIILDYLQKGQRNSGSEDLHS